MRKAIFLLFVLAVEVFKNRKRVVRFFCCCYFLLVLLFAMATVAEDAMISIISMLDSSGIIQSPLTPRVTWLANGKVV
jgi:hypothetical protein